MRDPACTRWSRWPGASIPAVPAPRVRSLPGRRPGSRDALGVGDLSVPAGRTCCGGSAVEVIGTGMLPPSRRPVGCAAPTFEPKVSSMSEQPSPFPDHFRAWLAERGPDAYALVWVAGGREPAGLEDMEVPRGSGGSGIAHIALLEVTRGRAVTMCRWFQLDDGVGHLAILTTGPVRCASAPRVNWPPG